VSRIFLSHSSANNIEAVALRDWLKREGWEDVFLDVDPERGIAAGERWERALNDAASRCEAVLFLISRDWLASGWCLRELNLACRLNKRLFGLLVEEIPVTDLPMSLTGTWQIVRLCSGTDHLKLRVLMPITGKEAYVTFSAEALGRLKAGLQRAGLDSSFFPWPPEGDPNRPPYRGLRPLAADDAGIFFGRDAAIIEALDMLRGLRNGVPPRLLAILGASGAGKSSFLRAGLFPRLARDDRNFLPLGIIRPGRAAITGETGLLRALEGACELVRFAVPRADLRAAIQGGAAKLRPFLQELADKATPIALDTCAQPKGPALILLIDQGEELFLAEGQNEAAPFLTLLCDLLKEDAPAVIAVFAIRSDNYERLQLAKELEGVRKQILSLPPMPKGSYADVIKGPARLLDGTARALKIEDGLVDALLVDIEADGAKDALPLLAFTLERLYGEYHAGGRLKLSHYNELGRVKGSINAAVERAFEAADLDPAISKDRLTRLSLLRRSLIPWLADVDPETGAPRRRIARLSEIPVEALPLIEHFIEQRLLVTDVDSNTGEKTIEPAHEALLRQWSLLQDWLAEDAVLLGVMDGVKRASRDWTANGKIAAWLTHSTGRLEAAERLLDRPDLAANLGPTDRKYLVACRSAEAAAKGRARRTRGLVYVLLLGVIAGLIIWINQAYIHEQWNSFWYMWPYKLANMTPLTPEHEQELTPLESFRECAKDCPEMIVIPAGSFTMGSPVTEDGRDKNEGPQHRVTIATSFAISRYDVTFADWDACARVKGCSEEVSDGGFGRGTRPVINVSWKEAQQYVTWLVKMTGRPYRLLSEAEWEYAARAGSTTAYFWGDEIGKGNCTGCDGEWADRQTSPVGSFKRNAFGLSDMVGNVWQWVQDCFHDDYNGAPIDGKAWIAGKCNQRVARGGAWNGNPQDFRSAGARVADTDDSRDSRSGFRLGRTLCTKANAITVQGCR
jgi:formylglycine-generating enzyme required for sulfatase activity